MRCLCFGVLLAALAFFAAPSSSTAADDFKLEEGFTLLFNGKDLTGWKKEKGGDKLDGKTEAYDKRFNVVDGVLVIDPAVKGDVKIATQKEFDKDLIIKFDFKPGKACNNDLFLRGQKFDIVLKLKGVKEGEWNQMEIIIKGDKAEFKINGESARSGAAKAGATPFMIRAEFGVIEFRRMRFKE